MKICKMVIDEIREATANALYAGANWTDEDYVGYVCDREGIDIDSPEINSIVFTASEDFELGIL